MVRRVCTSFLELAPGISEGREGRTTAFLAGLFGPTYLRPQSKHKDPAKQELMRAKVVKVRRLGYIKAGAVKSGTSFFSVDKGATDIRMVYNGTSCGLNDILYAPTLDCRPFEQP